MLATQLQTPSLRTNNKHHHQAVHKARPAVLKPSKSNSDDLKVIKGIGPVIEKALNASGIYSYRQIAHFTPANIEWVNTHLDFHGRIEREDWIGQAKALLPKHSAHTSQSIPPALLDKPLNTGPDDLKRIKGIGHVLEKDLHELGIYHYQQIAIMTTANASWVDQELGFPGRLQRENWIGQARTLMAGSKTEYAKRFDQGKTPYKD